MSEPLYAEELNALARGRARDERRDRRFRAACAAMQGILASERPDCPPGPATKVAGRAVGIADALLARLDEAEPKATPLCARCGLSRSEHSPFSGEQDSHPFEPRS